MVCGLSLPQKISEDDLGFFMRQRLRFASAECGMTLTAEKAKNWAPKAFEYLSRQAVVSIPTDTLSKLDKDRVQHIPSDRIVELDFPQFLAVLDRLNLTQLYDFLRVYQDYLSEESYQSIVQRLNPVQERWIQACDPEQIPEEESLANRLRCIPRPLRVLALVKYYWNPSERSTRELLKLSERDLQSYLGMLSLDAWVACYKEGTIPQRVAILMKLRAKDKKAFIAGLDLSREKASVLSRTYEVMRRSLQAEYEAGCRDGIWHSRYGLPLFITLPFPPV